MSPTRETFGRLPPRIDEPPSGIKIQESFLFLLLVWLDLWTHEQHTSSFKILVHYLPGTLTCYICT
jgi:hypothetical protein